MAGLLLDVGTGILLMIFHFTEAHLWILPYFRENYIQNLTMQWKSGGAYVGAWNMLVYGSSMYIMEKSSENDFCSRSKPLFLFFRGLINVMFNWAHHVYAVPNPGWIRYAAYLGKYDRMDNTFTNHISLEEKPVEREENFLFHPPILS
ncbi:hypothetical protein [Chryseobacterium indoltheticum]|uniref:hypothetical protein n=1 Tax=Chryseobacterium indoltheticum TaxID=254 RepID=UPI003F492507